MPVYFFISAFLSLSPCLSVSVTLPFSYSVSFSFCPPTLYFTVFDALRLSVFSFLSSLDTKLLYIYM